MDARAVDEVPGAVRLEVLGDEVDDVEAEPVDATLQPPAQHRVDRLAHLRVLPVEVRLLGVEHVQVVLAGALVGLPRRPGEPRAPVVRLGARRAHRHTGAWWPPPVPVAFRAVPGRAGLDEPRVLVARVVGDDVDDQLHVPGVQLADEPVDVGERAEHRVDALVVADVVAVVDLRRRVERRHPEHVGTERRDVVEPVDQPRQVADAVTVAVGEAARVDLVDDRGLPPGLALCCRLRLALLPGGLGGRLAVACTGPAAPPTSRPCCAACPGEPPADLGRVDGPPVVHRRRPRAARREHVVDVERRAREHRGSASRSSTRWRTVCAASLLLVPMTPVGPRLIQPTTYSRGFSAPAASQMRPSTLGTTPLASSNGTSASGRLR